MQRDYTKGLFIVVWKIRRTYIAAGKRLSRISRSWQASICRRWCCHLMSYMNTKTFYNNFIFQIIFQLYCQFPLSWFIFSRVCTFLLLNTKWQKSMIWKLNSYVIKNCDSVKTKFPINDKPFLKCVISLTKISLFTLIFHFHLFEEGFYDNFISHSFSLFFFCYSFFYMQLRHNY